MSRDIRGEDRFEAPPRLGPLVPRLTLSQPESRPRTHKRGADIVPEGIANEVDDIQRVPLQFVAHVREGLPSISPVQRPISLIGLDTDDYLIEIAPVARARKAFEHRARNVGREMD